MSDRSGLLIVGVMFLSIGLFNIVDGFMTGYRIIKWSKSQGTILSSYLQECSRGKAGRGLSPKISYSYLINNATYVSYAIAPSHYSDCMPNRDAENVISKYPEQAAVLVYFNQQQPNDAFVFGGKIGHWYDFAFFLGGILCIFLTPYVSSILR